MATNNLTIDSDDDNSQPSALFQERIGPGILQLNVEGLTRSKRDILKQLAKEHSAVVLLLLVGQVSNMIVHFVRKAPNLAHW